MAAARQNALAAGPRPAVEAVEWWTRLLVGEYFEVEYSDDNVAHERMALWPVSEVRWVVKSPDGDVMIENLDGLDPETGPSVSRPLRRRAGALAPLYRFRVRLTDRQLRSSIVIGLGLAHGKVEISEMPVVENVRSADGESEMWWPAGAFGCCCCRRLRRRGGSRLSPQQYYPKYYTLGVLSPETH